MVGFFKMGINAAQIGLVEFDHRVVTRSPLTPKLSAITAAIDNAPKMGGSTFVSGALKEGQNVLNGLSAREGVPKVIVLLTDGAQTYGGNDQTAIREANAIKALGTTIMKFSTSWLQN